MKYERVAITQLVEFHYSVIYPIPKHTDFSPMFGIQVFIEKDNTPILRIQCRFLTHRFYLVQTNQLLNILARRYFSG